MKLFTATKSWYSGSERFVAISPVELAKINELRQSRRDPQYCGFGWAGWTTVTPYKGYFRSGDCLYFSENLKKEVGEVVTGYGYSNPSTSHLFDVEGLGRIEKYAQPLSKVESELMPSVQIPEVGLACPRDGGDSELPEGTKVVGVHTMSKSLYVVSGGRLKMICPIELAEGEIEEREV